MDRALNLDTLSTAMGEHPLLPSPADLQRLLANTEIGLFTQQAKVGEGLLDAGWYLQSVATARADLQLFPTDRRRLAHQVSAHIFDLALQAVALERDERLRYTFAAQIGYLGGELTPNATALARRIPLPISLYDWPGPGIASMGVGILLLALNRREIYPILQARRSQLDEFARRFGDLSLTAYAAVNGVIRGIWELMNYLTYGQSDTLGRAAQWFQDAIASEPAASDVDSRWVAAHLLNISDALGSSSVWSVLPPNLPAAARAMTLGEPPVLLLWPPQLSFLKASKNGVSPLDPSVQRLILSFPTSAGKSLLAQLFVITQLISTDRDVCVVAPTHSLCRELAGALDRRLRTLGYQLHQDGPLGFSNTKPPGARVVVMTPEKLAARLRSNPSTLLAEFGMFVVDEAHLIADGERGWRLEETISFLHHLTRDSDHRLLVLSAALGNEVHIVGWIDNGSGVISKHENWRGPRRLNAIYTIMPDWGNRIREPARGRRHAREIVPLKGVLHLKTLAGNTQSVRGEFTEPVGKLVRRSSGNRWVHDDTSTRQRTQLVPLIVHVATTGPVLVVEATRTEAQRLAEEVFELLGEDYPAPFALIDTVRSRLGPNHLLTRILGKGVAFHHSALPTDIQAEVEDAVRKGDIRCLVATTTLTEGVNLPFKTVIVAHRDYWGPDGQVRLVDAPRLLNAIGRAGRAGQETEGWLVLFEQSDFAQSMFDELDRTGSDVEVRSTLTSEAALEALARIEATERERQDAILSCQQPIADGFISYVWFVADALEELRGQATMEAIAGAIRDTLAWHQLDDDSRTRLLRVAEIAFEGFTSQPADRRRRWSRTGTSLPSAATLETVAESIFQTILAHQDPTNLAESLRLLVSDGRLRILLDLAENRQRGFKARRNDPRDHLIDVNVEGLLLGWIAGDDLQHLADHYLMQMQDADYRYEQLSEFIAGVFEHHLPWTIGIIVGWVNHSLEAAGSPRRLPEELPGAIHFGVGSSDALELMLSGVRSRRLANRVAAIHQELAAADDQQTLRQWLPSQGITAWREQFDASPTELLDLLAYARAPEARLVSEVLAGEAYKVPFIPLVPLSDGVEARIEPEQNQPAPAPLAVLVEENLVGRIAPEHHNDIALLRDIGIPLTTHIQVTGNQTALELRIADEP